MPPFRNFTYAQVLQKGLFFWVLLTGFFFRGIYFQKKYEIQKSYLPRGGSSNCAIDSFNIIFLSEAANLRYVFFRGFHTEKVHFPLHPLCKLSCAKSGGKQKASPNIFKSLQTFLGCFYHGKLQFSQM